MRRRDVLTGMLAAVAACRSRGPRRERTTMTRAPALFIGHGAPLLATDAARGAPLVAWGRELARPHAVLVVSAHWEHAPPALGTTERLPLVYDFYGFPEPLYRVQYPAPGAPELADRVAALLGGDVARASDRGLDHGVWTPLVHLLPDADVPVLQLSLPSASGAQGAFALGRALAPLRDDGVLIVGSGNITHNLRERGRDGAAPESWAREFDDWARAALAALDVDELLAYRERAPALRRNHPTEEHWLPLYVALGASAGATRVRFPVEGWEFQNLSRRAVELS